MPRAAALIIREVTGTLLREIRLDGRSAPHQPQETPIEHDMRLTKYPGNDEKSVQMLGASEDPVTFRGKIRDRWTAVGFADAVHDTLRSITRDGELLDVENLKWKRQCILRRFVPMTYWTGHLDYELIFEVFGTGGEGTAPTIATESVDTASDMTRGMQQGITDLETAQETPLVGRIDEAFAEMDAAIADASDAVAGLVGEYGAGASSAALTQNPGDIARRAAAFCQQARDSVRAGLTSLRAVTPATATSLVGGLDLIRSSAYLGGLMQAGQRFLGTAREAGRFFEERAAERVLARVIGRAGRTLSELSLRFYGTPHDWPRIARANGLRDNLVGTSSVDLIIPA